MKFALRTAFLSDKMGFICIVLKRKQKSPHFTDAVWTLLPQKEKLLMRTVGIIAEYNPFHSGHEYHLKEAKKRAGADYAVIVMSPDFVQRGTPAVFDKYTRAEMALRAGADLVLELPACYACGSAEFFAEGAVALLDRLGVVDALCFGSEAEEAEVFSESKNTEVSSLSESPDIYTFSEFENTQTSLFARAADFLLNEPESYRKHLQGLLRAGKTFPQARAQALQAEDPALAVLLGTPNNVLGVEYCKSLQKFSSAIRPLPIRRKGNGYDSTSLSGDFCSATALRQALLTASCPESSDSVPDKSLFSRCSDITGIRESELFHVSDSDRLSQKKGTDQNLFAQILPYVPTNCHSLFEKAAATSVSPDDLLPFLIPKLLERDDFSDILDISSDLSDRIAKLRFSCIGHSYGEIVDLLKTRQLTQVRIQRALLHLILGLRAEDLHAFRTDQMIYYAKVLGFRSNASPLLHEIKKSSRIPLIVKSAKAASLLKEYWGDEHQSASNAEQMLRQDFLASHLYRSILSYKYQMPFRSGYQLSPVILTSIFSHTPVSDSTRPK